MVHELTSGKVIDSANLLLFHKYISILPAIGFKFLLQVLISLATMSGSIADELPVDPVNKFTDDRHSPSFLVFVPTSIQFLEVDIINLCPFGSVLWVNVVKEMLE